MKANIIRLQSEQKKITANIISIQFGKALDQIVSIVKDGIVPFSKGTMEVTNYDPRRQQEKILSSFEKPRWEDNVGKSRPLIRQIMGFQFIQEKVCKEKHIHPMLWILQLKMKPQSLLSLMQERNKRINVGQLRPIMTTPFREILFEELRLGYLIAHETSSK